MGYPPQHVRLTRPRAHPQAPAFAAPRTIAAARRSAVNAVCGAPRRSAAAHTARSSRRAAGAANARGSLVVVAAEAAKSNTIVDAAIADPTFSVLVEAVVKVCDSRAAGGLCFLRGWALLGNGTTTAFPWLWGVRLPTGGPAHLGWRPWCGLHRTPNPHPGSCTPAPEMRGVGALAIKVSTGFAGAARLFWPCLRLSGCE